MELILTPEEEKFRDEVREFVSTEVSEEIRRKTMTGFRLNKEDHESWQRKLYAKGWMAPGWPVEHGGTGWTPMQKHIFEEECAAAGAPPVIAFGVTMVAPVIMAFGNQEQKGYYLPRILRSDDWWCQGYSEPGSGSDLASLRTKAFLNGDHYIVNQEHLVRLEHSVSKQVTVHQTSPPRCVLFFISHRSGVSVYSWESWMY